MRQRNWWIRDQSAFIGSFDTRDLCDLGSLILIKITAKEHNQSTKTSDASNYYNACVWAQMKQKFKIVCNISKLMRNKPRPHLHYGVFTLKTTNVNFPSTLRWRIWKNETTTTGHSTSLPGSSPTRRGPWERGCLKLGLRFQIFKA